MPEFDIAVFALDFVEKLVVEYNVEK